MPCIDLDAVHGQQVDHQATVAGGVAGEAMSAAAHRDQQVVGTRETDSAHHVLRHRAAGYQGRMPVEIRVPNPASAVVAGITRQQQLSLQGGAQILVYLPRPASRTCHRR